MPERLSTARISHAENGRPWASRQRFRFSNVLRLELKPFGVKVMTVNPGPVYTNFFNIADESGSYVNNVQRFMLDPDDVAWQVVHFFGSNRRELNLPLSLATFAKLYQIFPRIGDWASLKFASRK